MTVNLYLTDEPSYVEGYLRAKLGARSDVPSLVRAVTSTIDGPTSGTPITRSAGGTILKWITDPLAATPDLTTAAWTVLLWALESSAAANAALRVQVDLYRYGLLATLGLDDNPGTELPTTLGNTNRTQAGVAQNIAEGDRLAISMLVDDATAGSQVAGHTVTFSYNGQVPHAEGDSYLICPVDIALLAAIPTATRARVRRTIHDLDATILLATDAEVNQAIEDALVEYSRTRPRFAVAYLSGDGTATDFPYPRGWMPGFSSLYRVEYPADQTPAVWLESDAYQPVVGQLGVQPTWALRILDAPVLGTNNVAVSFSALHLHTTEINTVPAGDFEALCWLAGANVALMKAAQAANSSEPTVAADSVSRRDDEQRWRSVYKALHDKYEAHVGIGGGDEAGGSDVRPASVTVDWDVRPYGRDWLFHSARTR